MLSAFPARTRQLLCLVGAEISASPGAWPQPRPRLPDDLGLRYRYQLTSVSPLGVGPAAFTALLADAALAGSGPAAGTDGARATVRHTAAVPPAAGGPAAPGTVVYAKGRLTGHAAGPPGPVGGDVSGAQTGHVVVLGGTGPAGLAVARAAIGLGAERLTLVGAVPGHTEAVSSAWPARYSPGRVRAACPGDLAGVLADADGLIRAVPAGTRPRSAMPVPARLLRPAMWVADLAYRPAQSSRHDREHGGPAPGGHRDAMLAWQTVGAFRLATGSETDAERTLRYLAAVTGTVAGNARMTPVRAAPAR